MVIFDRGYAFRFGFESIDDKERQRKKEKQTNRRNVKKHENKIKDIRTDSLLTTQFRGCSKFDRPATNGEATEEKK